MIGIKTDLDFTLVFHIAITILYSMFMYTLNQYMHKLHTWPALQILATHPLCIDCTSCYSIRSFSIHTKKYLWVMQTTAIPRFIVMSIRVCSDIEGWALINSFHRLGWVTCCNKKGYPNNKKQTVDVVIQVFFFGLFGVASYNKPQNIGYWNKIPFLIALQSCILYNKIANTPFEQSATDFVTSNWLDSKQELYT